MKLNKHIKNTFLPHKRNGYRPHAIRHHGLAVVAALLLLMQGIYNVQTSGNFQVLGYATNISIGDLLSLTNQQRQSNGLSSLTLNSQLNNAAQSKAAHMIENDYWAHTSPDGITPWYWIDISGYSYNKAGENLAYGFATSSGTVNGWMESPGHRANILDSNFKQVGFGIANGANYQGGENTVVVAMYAQPTAPAPTPAPAPAPVAASQPTAAATPPAAESVADVEEEPTTEEAEAADESQVDENEETERALIAFLSRDDDLSVNGEPVIDNLNEVKGSTVTNFAALMSGQAHWSFYVSFGVLLSITGIYIVRHMATIYQLVKHGEHYVLGHPLLEASILYIAIWLVLFGSFGAVL